MTTGSGIAIGLCGLGAWLATVLHLAIGQHAGAVICFAFATGLSWRAFFSPLGRREKGAAEDPARRPTNPPRAK